MAFEARLDQAVAMLQRRGRVMSWTLKLQFGLDDETLESLREEILYSQPLVRDDEGKGLIWAGEVSEAPEPWIRKRKAIFAPPSPPYASAGGCPWLAAMTASQRPAAACRSGVPRGAARLRAAWTCGSG